MEIDVKAKIGPGGDKKDAKKEEAKDSKGGETGKDTNAAKEKVFQLMKKGDYSIHV
jgi:hypothetical protein